jgi:hypothetical protein
MVGAFLAILMTAGMMSAVVWYNLDKLFAFMINIAIWGAFALLVYAVKCKLFSV